MKTLRMAFAKSDGTTRYVSYNYARDNVTASVVEDAMETMIARNIIPGGVAAVMGASLIDRTITPLF